MNWRRFLYVILLFTSFNNCYAADYTNTVAESSINRVFENVYFTQQIVNSLYDDVPITHTSSFDFSPISSFIALRSVNKNIHATTASQEPHVLYSGALHLEQLLLKKYYFLSAIFDHWKDKTANFINKETDNMSLETLDSLCKPVETLLKDLIPILKDRNAFFDKYLKYLFFKNKVDEKDEYFYFHLSLEGNIFYEIPASKQTFTEQLEQKNIQKNKDFLNKGQKLLFTIQNNTLHKERNLQNIFILACKYFLDTYSFENFFNFKTNPSIFSNTAKEFMEKSYFFPMPPSFFENLNEFNKIGYTIEYTVRSSKKNQSIHLLDNILKDDSIQKFEDVLRYYQQMNQEFPGLFEQNEQARILAVKLKKSLEKQSNRSKEVKSKGV